MTIAKTHMTAKDLALDQEQHWWQGTIVFSMLLVLEA
jgi:hypothetical protein